jgi:hypothetical protein
VGAAGLAAAPVVIRHRRTGTDFVLLAGKELWWASKSLSSEGGVSVAGIPGANGMFALVARVLTSAGSVAGLGTSHFHTDIEYDDFRLGKR